ncbi:MAG: XkdX family protein [Sarcina sp.]
MSFQTIKEFYQLGLWNKEQIVELMKAGVITIKQYEEIVGIPN